jgi:hypothetical protein
MMKKLLLLFTTITISFTCFAKELPMILGDTLYTTSGFKIVKDESLKIGVGTMTDGDFKYTGSIQLPCSITILQPAIKGSQTRQMPYRGLSRDF